ncbi:ATP-binding protein, partial [Spirillospora sp. NPDC049652]
AAGIEPVVRTTGTPLPDEADGLFGWAVREAVTNVVRHSRARRCEIVVRREPDAAVLSVTDDGTASEGSFTPGNGLTGLTERLGAAGGDVIARPRPSGGFAVTARLPLPPDAGPAGRSGKGTEGHGTPGSTEGTADRGTPGSAEGPADGGAPRPAVGSAT